MVKEFRACPKKYRYRKKLDIPFSFRQRTSDAPRITSTITMIVIAEPGGKKKKSRVE
ncbi:MAG TPA: hypothetical protein VFJ05_04545 [Nitrososphaeraceae archaeon]|nr:hypothetical protein [Nitrososphaeraceae archaeon]